MLSLKTFKKGGVHPPHEKLSARSPVVYGEVPDSLLIPVDQHIGRPLRKLVSKGSAVRRGERLAESSGFVSSNLHAPLDGKVQKILRFPLLGGQVRECIQITPEHPGRNFGEIIKNDPLVAVDLQKMLPDELRKIIADAGIVGMGGAGFPTHVKLSPPADKKIDTLIINGAECEPYITSDHRLMLEKPDELIKGIEVLQRIFDQIPVYIGIEENKPDAIETLEKATTQSTSIRIVPLKARYPQGGEKQLIKAVLDREVPSKGLPMDVGVVVQNVATVVAIHDAVFRGRPLTERVVTVSGDVVKQPGNIVLPIGTPVSRVMQKFDINPEQVGLMISGGPMMGRTSYSFESPITKTCSALLFFGAEHFIDRKEKPCIRCGNCVKACPMGLTVARLTEMIRAGGISEPAGEDIMDCMECGSCSYICPADRRLVHWMRLGKNIIKREN